MSVTMNKANTSKIIYVLYLIGLVMPLFIIIGLIMAYVNHEQNDDWVQSHFHYQIRTFWIGLLFSMISSLLTLLVIGYALLLATALWFIIRCVKGLKYLDAQQAQPNVLTWLID